MADPDSGDVGWYSPTRRAILPLAPPSKPGAPAFHLPRSLAKTIRKAPFLLSSDLAFGAVTQACGEPRPERPESWIDDQILRMYAALHNAGHAHSIEAWRPPEREGGELVLVGGIYGVSIGRAFIAESMFCRPEWGGTDASKVCLAALVGHLRVREYQLLDVQIANPHTKRFGVIEVPKARFLRLFGEAAKLGNMPSGDEWGVFDAAAAIRALASVAA